MAQVRIEPGGKVLAGIIILGALLFLFFKVVGGTHTQSLQEPPPGTMAPQARSETSNQPQTIPSTSNESQTVVTPSTQPESAVPGTEKEKTGQVEMKQNLPSGTSNGPIKIFFDFNRATINKNVYCIFDMIEVIARRSGSRNLRIVVEGNADSIGPPWYNVALSRMRAAHVADSLSKRLGIPLDNIELVANGSSMPAASNETRDGRAENRRTEIHISTN